MNKPTMRVFEYCRVSTASQVTDQQHNTVVKYCAQKGLTIHKIVSDIGISGKVSYRDRNLYAMLQEMREGDCLIVSEVSRLSRSMFDLNELIHKELKPRKLRLKIISMGIDLDCQNMTAVDEMILNNFAFAAQLEREMITSRVRSSLDVVQQNIERYGCHIVQRGKNKGKRITKLGNGGNNSTENASKAGTASGRSRARQALSNEHNQAFVEAVKIWADFNEPLTNNSDFRPFTDWVIARGLKTSTGLEMTFARCRSMWQKLHQKEIV